MDIWVKDTQTGTSWVLDGDTTKPVYNDASGQMVLDLSELGRYRFYPMNPESPEVKRHEARLKADDEGYQLTIFDF
jgi:hypothetical protein